MALTWTWTKFANEDRFRLFALAFSHGVVAGFADHLPLLNAFIAGHRTLPRHQQTQQKHQNKTKDFNTGNVFFCLKKLKLSFPELYCEAAMLTTPRAIVSSKIIKRLWVQAFKMSGFVASFSFLAVNEESWGF